MLRSCTESSRHRVLRADCPVLGREQREVRSKGVPPDLAGKGLTEEGQMIAHRANRARRGGGPPAGAFMRALNSVRPEI